MPSTITFDHAVLNVRALRRATENFGGLGFQVLPGGRHAGGMTHNAIIPLADASYLELLAPARPGLGPFLRLTRGFGLLERLLAAKPPFARYFARHLAGSEGLVDYAIHCPDLETVLARASKAGLIYDGPYPGARTKPDGQRIAWKLALLRPGEPENAGLPFLIQDETPRALRVPTAPDHPNGVQGVRRLAFRLSRLESWTRRMGALLGQEPLADEGTGASFRLGSTLLTAHGAEGASSPVLELSTPTRSGPLPRRATHGARVDLV